MKWWLLALGVLLCLGSAGADPDDGTGPVLSHITPQPAVGK